MKLNKRQLALGAGAVAAGTVGGGFTTLAQRLMSVGGGGGGSLILDQLTSVTPIAVFSTRKLLAAYAGNAMNVTSSGGGTSNIGFTGSDLNTTALASFVGANTGTVNTWYDQSGNAYHATQFTNGSTFPLPVVRASSSNFTLGGTHVALNTTNPGNNCLVMPNTSLSTPAAVTIAFCFIFNSSVNWGSSACLTDGAPSNWRYQFNTTATQYSLDNFGSIGTGGTIDSTTIHTVVGTFDNAGTALANLYVDNVLTISSLAIDASAFLDGQVIFGSQGGGSFDINCGEMFFLNNIMSSGDRSTYHSSCQTYWGSN